MSAISGILHFNEEPVAVEHSRGIMRDLQKYPADDVQAWHDGPVFLGCHAQWITPESVGEQLPYYDSERKLAITADAIIDNRPELFDLLQVEHGRRAKITDSELILLAYRKWEEDAPKYLVGEFAFVIWDERKRKLFGARDFSGGRTLYYYRDAKRFVFCTTIQPLFSLPYIEKRLNEEWLAEFLAIPGMQDAVDDFSSVYQRIEQIPPSHSIRVREGNVEFSRYCNLTDGAKLRLKSDREYEEAFQEVFRQAVNSRLRSRLDVGAQLSGGLDSGSVASFAAKELRNQNKKLHTFSYIPVEGFIDWTPKRRIADERPLIRSTVDFVGNIEAHYSDFADKSPLTEIDSLLESFEMPYKFFGNSFWTKGIYEEAHALGIGVLLNGARGNYTISWGPALDYYARLMRKWRWIRLYREIRLYSRNTGVGRKRVLANVRKKAYPSPTADLSGNHSFPSLIHPDFAAKTRIFEKLKKSGIDPDSNFADAYEGRKKQFEQLFFWRINGTVDTKFSLKYALWQRDPTNDLRVIRFCLSVPEAQFVQQGMDRALIRRSTRTILPDEIRLNQRVRGIQGADAIHRMSPAWPALVEELQQIGKESAALEFIDPQTIRTGISKMKEGPRPEYVFDPEFINVMRGLIVHRFINKHWKEVRT